MPDVAGVLVVCCDPHPELQPPTSDLEKIILRQPIAWTPFVDAETNGTANWVAASKENVNRGLKVKLHFEIWKI